MLIHEITLKNLLSFGHDTEPVELKPLNIIIGPNGSGKSNLIEAFVLLQSAPKKLAIPVREGGGIRDWLWKGAKSTPIATLGVVIENPKGQMPLRYNLSFTEYSQRLELVDENLENEMPYSGHPKPIFHYKYEHGNPVIRTREKGERKLRMDTVDPEQSILSQRKDPDNYPEITYVGEAFGKIMIYREWSFGRTTTPRAPQNADLPNVLLEENCVNIGLVLNRLRRIPEVKRNIMDALRMIYEGIDDFDVIIEAGTVQVFFQEGRFIIPATRLSDGTLRYLCLLAILLHPSPPPLVCIEEPELGMHPDIIPKIADFLKDAATRTQLVVTTHSEVLVDAFTKEPESVLVCEKRDGATSLRRLDGPSLSAWLEKYTLGQLWRSGEIGGNRW